MAFETVITIVGVTAGTASVTAAIYTVLRIRKAPCVECSNGVQPATSDMEAKALGLIGIYRSRLDAIEYSFFSVMQSETKQIDIVGSTIFGVRGGSFVTTERILDLLRSKKSRHEKFVLRILLSDFEYLAARDRQERYTKSPVRYFLAKELLESIKMFRKHGLIECIRFYKGAPTCFAIVCHNQKQMLLNPYPYEREAYLSWSIVIRDVAGGIFQDFLISHFESPWENAEMTEPYSEEYAKKLQDRIDSDMKQIESENKEGEGSIG